MYKLNMYNISNKSDFFINLDDKTYFLNYIMKNIIKDYNLHKKNNYKCAIYMNDKIYYNYKNIFKIESVDVNFIYTKFNNFSSNYYVYFTDLLEIDEVLFSDKREDTFNFFKNREIIKTRAEKIKKLKDV